MSFLQRTWYIGICDWASPLAWKAPDCSLRLALNGGNQLRLPTGGVQSSTLDLSKNQGLSTIYEKINIRISNKDLQFAETSSRSCEVQGLSHFLFHDLCQHRTSANFVFEDFFKDINPLPKGSLEKERDSS